ncbi:MAG: NAD-dependent epimerase/dehydratase family protein [Thermomicrobiales bacterium]|nr:NAD-dependent epimerase/dehydratase family protein [Thermomicrobiales bacterium]
MCNGNHLRILLLGGTGFLGRAITAAAVTRGHEITCLARGNGEILDGTVFVQADRDDDNTLAAVSDQSWDAVIDLTRHPVHARRAVRDLSAQHWVYVSTSSVYIRGDVLEQDETGPVVDALDSDFLTDMSLYGAAKVACENVYREHRASHTIIRSGLIGGNGDHTGRTGYYPWRFAHASGEDVLVPDPTFPVAMIDVEDLAAWIIACAEQQHYGTFNATGNTTTLSEVLDLSQKITGSGAVPYVVSNEVLDAHGIGSWMGPKSLPLWVNDPRFRYVATLDTTAARKHGLTLRPLRDTLAAALEYEEHRQQPRLAGLSDEEEEQLRQGI